MLMPPAQDTGAQPAVEPIGYPLTEIAGSATQLRFRYRGSAGAAGQAGFVLAIAAVMAVFGLHLGATFCAALGGLVLLGALINWLAAWDLELDFDTRRYTVCRGLRGRRQRVTGSFDDLAAVHVAPAPYENMHVYLQPKGSRRGYDLYRGLLRPAAIAQGQALAARLALPLYTKAATTEETPVTAPCQPPPGLVTHRQPDGSLEIELAHGRWHREWLRLGPQGLEHGVSLLLAGRHLSRQQVAWTDVTQIMIAPRPVHRGLNTGRYRRLQPDWRSGAARLWNEQRAERRLPPAPLPWWRLMLYCLDTRLRESEQAIWLFRRQRHYLEFGSNWTLGDAALHWVFATVVTLGRCHGARFTTAH